MNCIVIVAVVIILVKSPTQNNFFPSASLTRSKYRVYSFVSQNGKTGVSKAFRQDSMWIIPSHVFMTIPEWRYRSMTCLQTPARPGNHCLPCMRVCVWNETGEVILLYLISDTALPDICLSLRDRHILYDYKVNLRTANVYIFETGSRFQHVGTKTCTKNTQVIDLNK